MLHSIFQDCKASLQTKNRFRSPKQGMSFVDKVKKYLP